MHWKLNPFFSPPLSVRSSSPARLAQQQRNAAYCSEWLNARVAPTGVTGYAILGDPHGVRTHRCGRHHNQRLSQNEETLTFEDAPLRSMAKVCIC